MATLALAGRSFEIAPYDIDDMLVAAPYVDAIHEMGEPKNLTQTLEMMRNTAAVLFVGLQKVDPSLTISTIVKMAFPNGAMQLAGGMRDVLAEFGLETSGEAKAPAPRKRKAAGASSSS
jgi:hypothetical protein